MIVTLAPPAHANRIEEITIPADGMIPDQWIGGVLGRNTPRYGNPPRAKVLLPDGYEPSQQYPLLVLLAGANSNYGTWSDPGMGRIETTAAGFPGIIVMPEGGTGFYTDWWSGGRRDSPAWESYTLDKVVPYIVKHYPIRPERRWHALAGVSMGGLGTGYLGGRMPGFFGSLAIISGLVDINLFPGMPNAAALETQFNALSTFDPDAVYGPHDGFYAQGHQPARLADNLQHTRVFMATGNGIPSNDGEPQVNSPLTDLALEVSLIHPGSDNYARTLRQAGVDLTYQVHEGVHDYANFRRELRDAIAWDLFAPVEDNPANWVNDTVATHGTLWGIDYRFDTAPDAIVRLQRHDGQLSISAAGSGVSLSTTTGCSIQVRTPAVIDIPITDCR